MNWFWDLVKAFLVGGVLCAAGQILIDKTKLTPARILTGYVVAGSPPPPAASAPPCSSDSWWPWFASRETRAHENPVRLPLWGAKA